MPVSIERMIEIKNNLLSQPIVGKTVHLRLVNDSDAEFILSLRLNEEKGKYLSATTPDLQKQKDFIAYSNSKPTEFYFVIESKQDERLGAVRIYDIQENSFCWGSWIIKENAPFNTSIESALLIYEFAFYQLGFEQSHFDVRKKNEKVVSFHQKMGSQIVNEDENDFFFIYKRADYEVTRSRYSRFLPHSESKST